MEIVRNKGELFQWILSNN